MTLDSRQLRNLDDAFLTLQSNLGVDASPGLSPRAKLLWVVGAYLFGTNINNTVFGANWQPQMALAMGQPTALVNSWAGGLTAVPTETIEFLADTLQLRSEAIENLLDLCFDETALEPLTEAEDHASVAL